MFTPRNRCKRKGIFHLLCALKSALFIATFTGCVQVAQIPLCQDVISHPSQIAHLKTLWSPPIDPLATSDLPAWQIEAHLGDQLARKLEWQDALWCYRRASLLLPDRASPSHRVLSYNAYLCHYLQNRPKSAVRFFESGPLVDVAPTDPAYRDLLASLGDCYGQLAVSDRTWQSKKDHVKRLLITCDPNLATALSLRSNVQSGDSRALMLMGGANKELVHLQPLMKSYRAGLKSPKKAGLLNALLPGSGYWYVGMRQTALTSFALNALFGAAAWRFLRKGDTAAGLIALSFESGWYLGGIQGARLAADAHNRRRFEPYGEKILQEQRATKAGLLHRGF